MTTVEINYQIAKLREERQQHINQASVLGDCIQELAKLRTRQQLASQRADDARYEEPKGLYEEMFGDLTSA